MLLPAMGLEPLPDNVEAQDSLANKLSSLTLLSVQGQAASSVIAKVSGRPYAVDVNTMKIETLTLHFVESGCLITIKTAEGEETIPCGYGRWQQGQTALFYQPLLFKHTPITTSGAWTAEDTFTIVTRLYETPFVYTLDFHFVGDEILIEIQVNVSLESLKPLLLTAHPL